MLRKAEMPRRDRVDQRGQHLSLDDFGYITRCAALSRKITKTKNGG